MLVECLLCGLFIYVKVLSINISEKKKICSYKVDQQFVIFSFSFAFCYRHMLLEASYDVVHAHTI